MESNTASLEADARAIQSRLAEQRRSYDTPADAKVTDLDNASLMGQPEKPQPQNDFSAQQPRSDTPPPSATAAETDNSADPADSAQVERVQDHDSSLPAPQSMSAEDQASPKTDVDVPEPQAAISTDSAIDSKAAAVEPESGAVKGSTDTFGTATDSSIQQPGTASEASTALDAESADEDDTRAAREELHNLISSSNDDESDIPAAFKTFDSNLPDEPEPDASQQGPKLFQSAPETETSLPKPQGPDADGSSPMSQPQEAVTKPEGESQDSREQAPPGEGPSGSQERYEDQETNSALAELGSRQQLSELDVDSLPGSASTSAQTDKPVSRQLSSRAEPAGTSSQAEVQPAETRAQIDSQAESSQTASSPQLERDTAKENEGTGEEDAAQLRQRMQQLRQAMADKEAALEAAQGQPPQQLSKQQESDLVDKEAALVDALAAAQSQQQQQQQQESQSDASNATLEQPGQLREEQQQQQETELGPGKSARVVPRPSGSAEAATIFLERPGAADDLRSYPIQPDHLEESDDEEQGIDLVALAAGNVLCRVSVSLLSTHP